MERRAPGRRAMVRRVVTLVAVALVAGVVLVACGGEAHPYTTTSPRTSNARDIQFLYKTLFYMALVVFVGVQAGLIYTVLRYRRRSDDDERPQQIHGNRTLEILWTIIPAAVLLVIFIPTVSTLFKFESAAKEGDVVVEVYGKQWWWEVHYPDLGVITANEVHVPANTHVQFKLMSNNVIHSFWVPRLTGKMDVMPGHQNKLGLTTPKEPGEYFGECAEFCGTSHAWMRFKVIVDSQADYDRWVASWKQGPSFDAALAAKTGDVTKAPAAFGVCLACHRINGVNSLAGSDNPIPPQAIGLPAPATNGPNLSLLGCRTTIAAGLLANTPENLATWIKDAPSVKQGSLMPAYGKEHGGSLTDEQVAELVTYLENQKPVEGCPTVQAPETAKK